MYEEMSKANRTSVTKIGIAVIACLLLSSIFSFAEDDKKELVFQAQAMGQQAQMGRSFNITIRISDFSTPEDQKVLLEAYEKAGNEGIVNAMDKMKAKGRLSMTGTLGYDIKYIAEFAIPNGRRIRIVTDRPINVGESWHQGRSMDYKLSVIELDLNEDEKKSTGTLIPLVEFATDKKTNQLTLKAYQNPWTLVDIMDRSKK